MAADRPTQAQGRAGSMAPTYAKPTDRIKTPATLSNANTMKSPGSPFALSKTGQKPGK